MEEEQVRVGMEEALVEKQARALLDYLNDEMEVLDSNGFVISAGVDIGVTTLISNTWDIPIARASEIYERWDATRRVSDGQ